MPEIRYKVNLGTSPEKVFEALTRAEHIAGWWTPDCNADAKEGGSVRFEFKGRDGRLDGYSRMHIVKLVPGKLVEWKCVEQDYQGISDWVGTTIRFHLAADGQGGTDLDFAHLDWKNKEGSFHRCTDGWGHVLKNSLKNYLESGRGEPYLVQLEKEAAGRPQE